MIRRTAILVVALAATCSTYVSAADHPTDNKRRIVNQAMPNYPPLAKTLALSGVVKIEAVVGADGNPKEVDVKGGHPLLVQAAVDAVRRWHWESAAHETKEPIEITFVPTSR